MIVEIGTVLRNSFSGNICFDFSVLALCSESPGVLVASCPVNKCSAVQVPSVMCPGIRRPDV